MEASSDQRSWDNSARWKADITPDHQDWKTTQAMFDELVADQSLNLDDILKSHFTPNERDLLLPATSPDYLVDLQRRNTHRYSQFLQGRFSGQNSTLPTKLTMLYFGFPVEPIYSDLFTALDADVEMLDCADANNYEVQPPLHFLTAHDQRNWGKDELRGREAPFSYIPVPAGHIAPLRYNGEKVDSLAGASGAPDTVGSSSQSPIRSTLRGGGRDDPPRKTGTGDFIRPEDARDVKSQGPWLWMAGFQGGYPFLGSNTQSISTAIRRLLSLGATETAEIVLRQYDVQSQTEGALTHDSLPLKKGSAVYRVLGDHAKQSRKRTHETCCVWFVHFKGETGPVDCLAPDGELYESSQIVLLEGDAVEHHAPRQPCAYFRLPLSFPLTKICGSNTYAPFLRTALQVIFGRVREPGDGHFSVSIGDENGAELADAPRTYGGLNPATSTVKLLKASAVDEHGTASPWKVSAQSLDQTSLAFYIHGYDSVTGRDYQIVNDRSAVPRGDNIVLSDKLNDLTYGEAFIALNEMLKAWASPDHLDQINHVNIWRGQEVWGETADLTEYEPQFDVEYKPFEWHATGPARTEPAWAQALAKYLEGAAEKGERNFVLQPIFETYELMRRVGGELTSVNLDAAKPSLPDKTLEEFREAVSALWEQTGGPALPDPSQCWISLMGLPVNEKGGDTGDVFVISPETTESEWILIQIQLTNPQVVVNVSSHGVADYARNLEQSQWGPRYGAVQDLKYLDRIGAAPGEAERVLDLEELVDDTATPDRQLSTEATQEMQRVLESDSPGLRPGQRRHSEPRADTWVRRPTIFQNWPAPVVLPIDGAPAERMLRTGGSGIPMITTQVMTPSEQVGLEKALEDMRGGHLRRLIGCHYKDCGFMCATTDMEAMRGHIADVHEATKCPWCPERLFRYWGLVQKEEHIAKKHGHRLAEIVKAFDVDLNAGPDRQGGLDVIDYEISPPRRRAAAVAATRTPVPEAAPPRQPSVAGRGERHDEGEGSTEEDEQSEEDEDARQDDEGEKDAGGEGDSEDEGDEDGSENSEDFDDSDDRAAAEAAQARVQARLEAKRAVERREKRAEAARKEKAEAAKRKAAVAARKRKADDMEDGDPGGSDGSDEAPRLAALRPRGDSLEWEGRLGLPVANYDPAPDMYCSRCLRKRPPRIGRPKKNDPSWEEQMEAHMDPNLTCRIRRGEGTTAHGLPNRSGWVRLDPKGKKAAEYKAEFLAEYPGYKTTIYPAGGGGASSNVWTQDPNNEKYKDNRGLPWPLPRGDATAEPLDLANTTERSGGAGASDNDGASDMDAPREEMPPEESEPDMEATGRKKAAALAPRARADAAADGAAYRDAPREEGPSEDEEPDPRAVERDVAGRDGRPKRRVAKRRRRG